MAIRLTIEQQKQLIEACIIQRVTKKRIKELSDKSLEESKRKTQKEENR